MIEATVKNFAVMTKDSRELIVTSTGFTVDDAGVLHFAGCDGVFREWIHVVPVGFPRELGTRSWD